MKPNKKGMVGSVKESIIVRDRLRLLVLGCQVRERRLIIKKRGTWKTKNTEETVKGFLQNGNRVFSRQQILKLVPSYENCNALRKFLVHSSDLAHQKFI